MFESEEEKKAKVQRTIIIIALVVGIIGVFLLLSVAWDKFKPLPQLTICKEEGYEAGKVIEGKEVCFKECIDKDIYNCRYVRFVT